MIQDRILKAVTGVCVFLTVALTAAGAAAQTTATAADVQRLQDEVYQANVDLSRIRLADSALMARLQSDLDEVREEAIYLKVKLRREGRLSWSEYAEVRDRLQDIRAQARGQAPASRPSSSAPAGGVRGGVGGGVASGTAGGVAGGVAGEPDRRGSRSSDSQIPVGYEIDARLQHELSSATAQVEDRFEATTVSDVYAGSRVIIPAGSSLRGIVRSVNKATRTDRKGELTVAFDQVTIGGRTYPMRGTVTQALESEGIRGEAGRIGAGSAVGAIIGGIIGGVRGALLGVLIGGGGTIAATEGKDVTLPPGTILRVRLDTPPDIR